MTSRAFRVLPDRLSNMLLGISLVEILVEAHGIVAEVRASAMLRRLAFGLALVFLALLGVHLTLAAGEALDLPMLEAMWRKGTWRLDIDQSVAEHIEYVLLLTAAAALWTSALRQRAVIHAVLGAVCMIAFLDGVLMLHEQAGSDLDPDRGWVGEIGYFAALSLLIGAAVLVALRASPRAERSSAILCLVCFAAVVGFGVGVDAIHAAVKFSGVSPFVHEALGTLEDGGELFFLMINTLVSLAIFHRTAGAGNRGAAGPSPERVKQ